MKNILGKLTKIQKEIKPMEKEGFNEFNKYPYLTEAQITTKMKELFDKYGVLFHYNSVIVDTKEYQGSKGDTQFLVTVKIDYAFIDSETEEKLSGIAYGQGADKGDKGIYKAITGAIKYIYLKTFNIPTGDDCEKESPELMPKIYCQRCQKNGKQTIITVADANFTEKETGFKLCSACFQIWLNQTKK